MNRLFVVIPCAGLALVALQNFGAFLNGTPAFDSTVREEGVFGDWRLSYAPAMYNRADYLFQLGFGLTNSDSLASAAIESSNELASVDAIEDRAASAIDALEQSVALAPGNAHAWGTLAWSYALEGEIDKAREALRASWTLAPRNLELALSRLGVAELIVEPLITDDLLEDLDLSEALDVPPEDIETDDDEVLLAGLIGETRDLTEFERRAVMADLEVLRRFAPRVFDEIVDTVDVFAEIATDLPPLQEDEKA